MSTFRSLRSRPSSRLRHVASQAALLGLAVVALVGTTGCATCCRPCPRPCPPPCCGSGQPVPAPMPPPMPVVAQAIAAAPAPAPVPAPAPKPEPDGAKASAADANPELPPQACVPFLAPQKAKIVPEKVQGEGTAASSSQLDKGGFVLWQMQGVVWQQVGWVFRMENSDMEHWVYKQNFWPARCALQGDVGTAMNVSFRCVAPAIQSLDSFFDMVRSMNNGNFTNLTYVTHSMAEGHFPDIPPP